MLDGVLVTNTNAQEQARLVRLRPGSSLVGRPSLLFAVWVATAGLPLLCPRFPDTPDMVGNSDSLLEYLTGLNMQQALPGGTRRGISETNEGEWRS